MARHPRTLTAAVVAYLALATVFSFVCDDAYISFRYARNWALGHGVRFNLGVEPPVEGYTNFGWVALAAGCEALGLPPWAVLPVLSACCGAVLIVLVHRAVLRLELGRPAADAAAVALAASPPMVVWATGGLATMPFALLVFLAFERLVLARSRASLVHAALAGIALALIRFEGIGWVVVLAIVAGAVRGPGRALGFLVAAVAGWAPWYGWRTVTYEDWLPNTARIKVDPGWATVVRGLRYLAMNLFALLLPLPFFLGLPAAWRRHGRLAVAVGAMALAFPAFAVVVGGDFMAMGRLLVPSIPFAALLLAWGVRSLLDRGLPGRRVAAGVGVVLFVGLLPVVDVAALPAEARAVVSVRHGNSRRYTEQRYRRVMRQNTQRWYQVGLELAELSSPGDSVVVGGAGAVSYASGLFVYDQHGLVTKAVTRQPPSPAAKRRMPGHDRFVRADFFLDDEPTWLRASYLPVPPASRGQQLSPPPPSEVRKELKKVGPEPEVRARYLPELLPRRDHWLLVVRRARPGEDTEEAWARLEQR